MAGIFFQPQYDFFVKRENGDVYQLRSLISVECMNSTAPGTMPQLVATFSDPNHSVSRILSSVKGNRRPIAVAPQPMQTVQLLLTNQVGKKAVAWSGYIDQVHTGWDSSMGYTVQLNCTGAIKLWAITLQSTSDVQSVALAAFNGISGSSILQYSADRVGYPRHLLLIDNRANAGIYTWGQLQAAAFTGQSQQQPWSAVVQSVLADSGVEWFQTEEGYMRWRPLGFLLPQAARPVALEDIIHKDLAISDQGVYTRIQVRWGQMLNEYDAPGLWPDAGNKNAQAMEAHLKVRAYVAYAPWIASQNGAKFLALALGLSYAANVLTGTVTIPADPFFRVGGLCTVPLDEHGHVETFYISSTIYNLEWNGSWTMTLGLTYGRAARNDFPYIADLSYPVASDLEMQDFPSNAPLLSIDDTNVNKITTTFTTFVAHGLPDNQVIADPSLLAPDSIIQIRTLDGKVTGRTTSGDYTVVQGHRGLGTALGLSGNASPTAKVTIIQWGPQSTDTSSSSSSDNSATPTGGNVTTSSDGSTLTTPDILSSLPLHPLPPVFQEFGPTDNTREPTMLLATKNPFYPPGYFHTGVDFAVPSGTPIYSVFDGVVASVGWDQSGYGALLTIQAGNLVAYYAHTSAYASGVAAGAAVKGGQVVAFVGSTGNSSGPHLHFGLYNTNPNDGYNAHYVNPVPYLKGVSP